MVLADSHRTSRIPCYSGSSYAASDFAYRAVTVSGLPFQVVLLSSADHVMESYNPGAAETAAGLGLFLFARRYSGNHFCFLFHRVLRCFTSPGWLALRRDASCPAPGFPIRTSWDHSLCAAPPGLSQLTTSFIASRCQGIHRAPLVA